MPLKRRKNLPEYKSLKEKIRAEGKEREAFRESLAHALMRARQAGREAATKCKPTPMLVGGTTVQYIEDAGPCGFAWVNVSPRNCRTANALKKFNALGGRPEWDSSSYDKAMQLWGSGYGQSVERKTAYAEAYSAVLGAWAKENDEKARVWSGSRLD